MARPWAALVLLLVAGCTGPADEAAPPPPVSPYFASVAEAEAGRYYEFTHRGGTLVLRLTGGAQAALDLFDGADARIGRYALGQMAATTDLRLDLAPGSYVIHFAALNGTLQVTSAGRDVRLAPLPMHVERHVLAQRPHSLVPPVPFLRRDAIDEPVDLTLARTPTALRLLADGGFGWLDLRLSGAGGDVFHAQWRGTPLFLFGPDLTPVPGTQAPENAHGPHLTGTLRVEDLSGALILEASSYSRARPAAQERVGTLPAPAPFTYGLLPPQPVAFEVAQGATHMLLWVEGTPDEGAGTSWVAIFGPGGTRLATAPVEAPGATSVAVAGPGTHVAVLLSGNVTLGADRAPGELALRPLQVEVTEVPAGPAGSPGWYAQANETHLPRGVLYNAWPVTVEAMESFGPILTCPPDASVALLQDGETLGAWGPLWDAPATPVGAFLREGPVTVVHDGYGESGCPRQGLRLASFLLD